MVLGKRETMIGRHRNMIMPDMLTGERRLT